MTPLLARLLIRLYPRIWRERYGDEFEELLRSGGGGVHSAADVVWWAIREHVVPTRGGTMTQDPYSFGTVLRQPSAFVPLAMSITALAVVLGCAAVYGIVHEADEGAAAHIWQILMAAQAPALAFFAVKWLRRAPKQTFQVLALQAGTTVANLAAVFFLT